MKVRRKHIRSVVERLLANHAITSPPVPLEQLTQALGIKLRRTPAEEPLSGFLLRNNGTGEAIIGVNKNQHWHRQRFSIGHEIGHFLLHVGQDVYVDGRSESGLKISLRGEEAGLGTNPEEIEANLFAAELLMPTIFLTADFEAYLKTHGSLDFLEEETVLSDLAKKYEVSKQALTYRLMDLDYVHR